MLHTRLYDVIVKILGIETSCDETAASVVEDGSMMLSNIVAGSLDMHIAYGGVVPEIAARSHIEIILPVIEQALKTAKTDWAGIGAIAVTQGPGLLGSLLIGVLTARTLAIAKQKPLYAVDHVAAHTYACFITDTPLKGYRLQKSPGFPLLSLIISGGHTQLVLYKNHFNYKLLGQTQDDAVGEAFDKVAKIIGLPYPGGPSISKEAEKGDRKIFNLPKARMDNKYDFSYSGLKTAVLRLAQDQSGHDYTFPSHQLPEALKDSQKADIAASFQLVAVETLMDKLKLAIDEFKPKSVVIAGGVAANQEVRRQADKLGILPTTSRDADRSAGAVIYPDFKLCTDNAAMIASLGYFMASNNRPPADPYSMEPDPGLVM